MSTRASTRKSRHQRRCCDSGYCYSKLHRALSWPMKVIDCLVKKALAFTSERNWQLVYVISEEGRRCAIGLGWVILFYWLIFGSPVQFCRRKQWLPRIRNFQYYVQVIFPHCHAVGVRSSRQKCKYGRLASQYIASAEWEASLRVRFWVLFI